MQQFHATVVEVYSEDGLLVVHFDDEGDHYLQIQSPDEGEPEDRETGYGNVDVEVDDQLIAGHNCFSVAELTRKHFRVVLARDQELVRRVGEVVVTFDLDDDAFGELQRGLAMVFCEFPGYRPTV